MRPNKNIGKTLGNFLLAEVWQPWYCIFSQFRDPDKSPVHSPPYCTYRIVLELTRVDQTGEYEKDSWAMDEDEQIVAVPKLKDEGNKLFAEKKYTDAAERYAKALGLLENLLLK